MFRDVLAKQKSKVARYTVLALIAGSLALATPVVVAEDNVLERADIKASLPEFLATLETMEGSIRNAERILGDVEAMDIEAAQAATESLFDDLKDKVNGVLDGLSPNSALMDNLEGAKANVIVWKRWYERQPSDYPDRDHNIMRLEEVIQSYGELTNEILAGRQETQNALRELLRAQFIRRMEMMVGAAEHGVNVTKSLVNSLRSLTGNIRQIAEQELPEQAISN